MYQTESAQLLRRIHRAQGDCSVPRFPVIFPGYGLGGSIVDHLKRLLPIWQSAINGNEPAAAAAFPATYTPFAANRGDANSYLWATFDDALPCTSWFGCYWEELGKQCAAAAEVSPSVHKANNYTMPAYNATGFERRWGPVLFAAALLHAWWRPSEALQHEIDRGVKHIYRGTGVSAERGARHSPAAMPREADGSRILSGGGSSHGGVGSHGRGESVSPEDGGGCLAMHIRRGDACPTAWRHCPPLDEYLVAARSMARRHRLHTLFVATEDEGILRQLRARTPLSASGAQSSAFSPRLSAFAEPWRRVVFQEYDRSPFNQSTRPLSGSRFWVEQRLRYSGPADRPLGRRPVVEFLVDIEAASRCSALVGSLDSHGSQLMLMRMASRLGAVPPFHSLVGLSCAITKMPPYVSRVCDNHTRTAGWQCPG